MRDHNIKKKAFEEKIAKARKGEDEGEVDNENKIIDLEAMNDVDMGVIGELENVKKQKKVKKINKKTDNDMDIDNDNSGNKGNQKGKLKVFHAKKKKKSKSFYITNYV